ncbi:penicillin-binding protein 2 [bacterium]|nr:penicillin-binding protein 2 [bacterium]
MKNWRINFIIGFFVLISGVIVWRLYVLQIKNGEYYQALALGQQALVSRTEGKRGDIFLSGNNLPFAQTKERNVIYIFGCAQDDENCRKNLEENENLLAKIVRVSKEEISASIKENKIFRTEVSEQQLKEIKKQNPKGVYSERILVRFYPKKQFASHLIGFVNKDGEGQYGVEGYYDNFLKPNRNLSGRKSPFKFFDFSSFSDKSALSNDNAAWQRKGSDIYLTIDYNIQYFAEKLLKEAKDKWDIDSGQVIVEEPSTGKILAMAEIPNFDPNRFSDYKNFDLFTNSSVQKLFEPGSVFKAFTMAAGLEEGLITPDTEYEDKGYVKLGGPPIYNFERRVWGKETMTRVLEMSINTGAVFVEQKLGDSLFLKYLDKFGFFKKTGVDIQGEEVSSNENLVHGWPRDFAVASFGQGVEVTPIQLVRAFGAIANNGNLMKPYVVDKIIAPDGTIIKNKPENQGKVISEDTAAKITSMLVSVVNEGSGRRGKVEGYFIAGKTGTAQVPLKSGGYSEDKTIQSFIGYFPALNPKVLILIKLDNPKNVITAGRCAAPLFKEIAEYIIKLWQIPPSY